MIEKIIENFNIEGKLLSIEENTSGIINKTYIVTIEGENKNIKRYIIQQINTTVFADPYKLMKNIENVTDYLKKQIIKSKDRDHEVLELIKTKNGSPLCPIIAENGDKEFYRMYKFIENSISYNYSTEYKIVFNTGKAFGNFQKLLKDYPMSKLEETIKDFHNTKKRYQKLLLDVKESHNSKVSEITKEIDFISKRANCYSLIIDKLGTSEIPYRVTHNDTKVNNIMMNKSTNDFLAVIDLDTVMPGSLLFDYGDGVRSTTSTTKDGKKSISIDLKLFEAYTDGYLSEMAPYITKDELSLMAESVRIITLELAIRFLDDYISGDTYFKINYPTHNLDRAKNQLKLVEDIEAKLDYMNNYIETSYKKYISE